MPDACTLTSDPRALDIVESLGRFVAALKARDDARVSAQLLAIMEQLETWGEDRADLALRRTAAKLVFSAAVDVRHAPSPSRAHLAARAVCQRLRVED